MARKRDPEVEIREKQAELAAARMELAFYRVMYEDMLRDGASEKGLAKAEEVVREWKAEISNLQAEISVIRK